MNTARIAKISEGTSRVAFHEGRIILHVANTYPGLLKCLMEVVQNSLDSKAQNIKVKVDLEERLVVVSDDGKGVS